jgi:hypothetical protein
MVFGLVSNWSGTFHADSDLFVKVLENLNSCSNYSDSSEAEFVVFYLFILLHRYKEQQIHSYILLISIGWVL